MIYPELADLLKINKRLNAMSGKGQGIVLKNKLQGIINKAKLQQSPEETASVFFYDIIKNHPFTGANRRTGFLAADVFLVLNGYAFDLQKLDIEQLAYKVRNENMSYDELLGEFRGGIEKVEKKQYA
jgi:death-on-curing family protein